MKIKNIVLTSLSISSALFLSACGGGSSGSNDSNAQPQPSPTKASIQLQQSNLPNAMYEDKVYTAHYNLSLKNQEKGLQAVGSAPESFQVEISSSLDQIMSIKSNCPQNGDEITVTINQDCNVDVALMSGYLGGGVISQGYGVPAPEDEQLTFTTSGSDVTSDIKYLVMPSKISMVLLFNDDKTGNDTLGSNIAFDSEDKNFKPLISVFSVAGYDVSLPDMSNKMKPVMYNNEQLLGFNGSDFVLSTIKIDDPVGKMQVTKTDKFDMSRFFGSDNTQSVFQTVNGGIAVLADKTIAFLTYTQEHPDQLNVYHAKFQDEQINMLGSNNSVLTGSDKHDIALLVLNDNYLCRLTTTTIAA